LIEEIVTNLKDQIQISENRMPNTICAKIIRNC